MAAALNRLADARRLVIKIGSAILVDAESGRLRAGWLTAFAAEVSRRRRTGQEVLIVSSGAIALGRRQLGLAKGPLRLEDGQAAAATGQLSLAHAFQEALAAHDITVALVLLTAQDTEMRRRYLNARNTLSALLARDAVAIINENDTVVTEEIRVGDNDRLAARVAVMMGADGLVLLSDVAGLHTADPRLDPEARLIGEVNEITAEVEAMASPAAHQPGKAVMGKGGMATKLRAARIAMQGGCHMLITDGRAPDALARADAGGGTWFLAEATPTTARKRWIAGSLRPAGSVAIDAGAARALGDGKSLLPAGVSAVEGAFEKGDAVVVRNGEGRELARGLIKYSAAEAARIAGHRSVEIIDLLGYRGPEELIHRDDLVLT